MILFTKPYLTIEYEAGLGCIIQHWKGFAKSEDFRDGIKKSIELFKQHNASKIISNTKDFAMVKKEDTDWVASVATPELVKHGLKGMAFIIPASAFTQMSVDNYKAQASNVLQIRYFDDQHKAQTWLGTIA